MFTLLFTIFKIIFAFTLGNFCCAEVRPNLIFGSLKGCHLASKSEVRNKF